MIPFGLTRAGDLVPVQTARRGLACGCFCPACDQQLIARQGRIRAWHFAHAYIEECHTALETSLHVAAKRILANSKTVGLPPGDEFPSLLNTWTRSALTLSREFPARIQRSKNVVLETPLQTPLGTIVPDVLMLEPELHVEFRFAHQVDYEKIKLLQAIRADCIEIDLRGFRDAWLELTKANKPIDTYARLSEFITAVTQDRIWLSNPAMFAAAEKWEYFLAPIRPPEEAESEPARPVVKYVDTGEPIPDKPKFPTPSTNHRRLSEDEISAMVIATRCDCGAPVRIWQDDVKRFPHLVMLRCTAGEHHPIRTMPRGTVVVNKWLFSR